MQSVKWYRCGSLSKIDFGSLTRNINTSVWFIVRIVDKSEFCFESPRRWMLIPCSNYNSRAKNYESSKQLWDRFVEKHCCKELSRSLNVLWNRTMFSKKRSFKRDVKVLAFVSEYKSEKGGKSLMMEKRNAR